MRGSSTLAALCLAVSIAATARAQDESTPTVAFELAGDAVIVRVGDTEKPIKVGCTPRSFASSAKTAYALCAPNVVVIVEAEPEPHVAERRPIGVNIVSLAVTDGLVYARSDTGLKPLSEYPVARAGAHGKSRGPVFEAWSPPAPQKLPKRPPPITGLEVNLAGTAGVGVDAVPGPFGLVDASLIGRFPFGLSLSAYGTAGAGTGNFLNGTRQTGPFGGDIQVAVAEVLLGFDSRWFALAVGSGGAMTEHGYDVEPLFVIRGRAGEVDGFTFTWHNSFAVQGPNAMGVIGGAIEFPVSKRLWLGMDVELGALRYGRFMMGLRQRLSPRGETSTIDLRASVGLAYVHSSSFCQTPLTNTGFTGDTECVGTNADYLGPGVSLGFVWRP